MEDNVNFQGISVPKIRELNWVFKFFNLIWLPVCISVFFQFIISYTNVYSIEALNIAASVVDKGQKINTESLLFKYFISKENNPEKIIIISCILALFITVISSVLETIVAWTISWNQSILNSKLTPEIIKGLIKTSNTNDIKKQESTVIQRWLLIKSISDFFHNVLANSIGSLFSLMVLIYFTYKQNIIAGHCILIIVFFWVLIMYGLNKIVLKKARNYTVNEEIVGKAVRSSVALSDILKSADIRNRFLKKQNPQIESYSKSIKEMGLWGSILYGALSGISSLSPIIVVIATVSLNYGQQISITTAATLYLFVSKLSSPLSSLARVIPILQNHRIDFVRFKNIYQLQKESQSKEIGILISNYKKLEIEPIYITIEKYKPLNFPKLVFESGKITCLKGMSGIGKTTLLKLISGRFDIPVQIKINDKFPIYNFDLIEDIAYLPQEPKLAELSIEENLELFSNDKNIVNPILRKMFENVTQNLSAGSLTEISSDVFGLSVGQRRAISLISIINNDKPIIILDEPLSHLDHSMQECVWEALQFEKKNKIIIISLHEPTYIEKSDKVISL